MYDPEVGVPVVLTFFLECPEGVGVRGNDTGCRDTVSGRSTRRRSRQKWGHAQTWIGSSERPSWHGWLLAVVLGPDVWAMGVWWHVGTRSSHILWSHVLTRWLGNVLYGDGVGGILRGLCL